MCVLSWGTEVVVGEEDTKMQSERSHYLSLSLPQKQATANDNLYHVRTYTISLLSCYSRLNDGPLEWLCPNPQNLWVCFSYGKRDFADGIKDLEMRDDPGLSRWTQCNHKGPYKTESNVMREAEGERERLEDAMLLALKVEYGSWANECRWPLKAGKGKEPDSLLEPPEEMQPCGPILGLLTSRTIRE